MVDNFVKVIYGWKIPSIDVDKVKDQLGEEIDEPKHEGDLNLTEQIESELNEINYKAKNKSNKDKIGQ